MMDELEPQQTSMPEQESSDQDALKRINSWLEKLEERAEKLIAAFQPEDLEPAQAAAMANKYIMLIARLLELRQQFTTEKSSMEERLLSLIFGKAGEE